jgi:hypothetical protein
VNSSGLITRKPNRRQAVRHTATFGFATCSDASRGSLASLARVLILLRTEVTKHAGISDYDPPPVMASELPLTPPVRVALGWGGDGRI